MLYVRPKPKEYGATKQIEGILKKGKIVLVIEAMISTGGSLLGVIDAIKRDGGIVNDVVIIYTHELEGAKEKIEHKGIKVHHLTEFTTVVEAAQEMGRNNKD